MANTALLSWDAFWNFIDLQSDHLKRANCLQIWDELGKIAHGSDQVLKDEVFKCAPEKVKAHFKYGVVSETMDAAPVIPSKLITPEMRIEIIKRFW